MNEVISLFKSFYKLQHVKKEGGDLNSNFLYIRLQIMSPSYMTIGWWNHFCYAPNQTSHINNCENGLTNGYPRTFDKKSFTTICCCYFSIGCFYDSCTLVTIFSWSYKKKCYFSIFNATFKKVTETVISEIKKKVICN